MSDHDRYRDGWGGWSPFYAEGYMGSLGSAHAISTDVIARKRQPIGFRGANPGQSVDDRGLPRIRVKARTGRTP